MRSAAGGASRERARIVPEPVRERQRGREKVRLGIVGAGAITQVMHLPILAERADVELAALSDPDEHKAAAVARRFGIPRVVGDDALLAGGGIDGVVIAAPESLHERLAAAALEAGKHVLVERPLSQSAQGARRLVALAKAEGKGLVVAMSHRYRTDVAALRSFVASRQIGDAAAVRAAWLDRKAQRPGRPWRARPEGSGGALADLGTPVLDLALWVLGCPWVERVSAMVYGDEGMEEEAHVQAVVEGGTTLSLSASRRFQAAKDSRELRVTGSEGAARLWPLSVYRQVGGRPMDVTPRQPIPRGGEDLFTSGYRRLLDHFARVASGEAEAPPPEEQVVLAGLVEAAYRSAREGREIELA